MKRFRRAMDREIWLICISYFVGVAMGIIITLGMTDTI